MEPVSETTKLGDDEFCIHTWNKTIDNESTKAVVVIFHGFGAHGLYPTVRYGAELIAKSDSFKVVAADMRGHGQSPGLKGYLPDVDTLLKDAQKVADHAISEYKPKKLFLMGSSMGGSIALEVARQMANSADGKCAVSGVLLLAPMLKLAVSSVEQTLLGGLACLCPQWHIIPSSSKNDEKQFRDENKRQECSQDPYISKGGTIRVGSANTCVTLANRVAFDKVTVPFWLGVAEEDYVVDKQGSLDLYEQSPSTDKTMKRYQALHGLLCEPPPLYDEISKDLLDWILARC